MTRVRSGVLNNEVDPHTGNVVQVPDEATHAPGSSSSGEIIYSDNENFKPGEYKNADWEELTPKQRLRWGWRVANASLRICGRGVPSPPH